MVLLFYEEGGRRIVFGVRSWCRMLCGGGSRRLNSLEEEGSLFFSFCFSFSQKDLER